MFFWKALQTFAGSFYIAFGLDSFLEANYSCKGLSELTMEVFFQRVLQAGLCSGAQLADSFVFLSQPAHRATQALQLGRVVLAAQTIEAFLGGADVALLTLQFFLNFLADKSMPWRMFFASKRNMLSIPWWSFFLGNRCYQNSFSNVYILVGLSCEYLWYICVDSEDFAQFSLGTSANSCSEVAKIWVMV